jgi:hypothetical protein
MPERKRALLDANSSSQEHMEHHTESIIMLQCLGATADCFITLARKRRGPNQGSTSVSEIQ